SLSSQAIEGARTLISEKYGADYLPDTPRVYKTKAKGAQEAHEAIRPAGDVFRSPGQAERELPVVLQPKDVPDATRLYELVWKRTIASQMADARGYHTQVVVEAGEARFDAKGKTVEFPGFRSIYSVSTDANRHKPDQSDQVLPPVKKGDSLTTGQLEARPHQTKPAPRLTEATLVKELEARGIGRPSTYASIIEKILHRDYVFKRATALVPTFTAFAVISLLEHHLGWLVDYNFTARMEDSLDDIAGGNGNSITYLREFYDGSSGLKGELERALEEIDARKVCTIPIGEDESGTPIHVRVGRFGPFLALGDSRADIPEGMPPDELTTIKAMELINERREGPRPLGEDPETGKTVYLAKGRFGPFVQLGEVEEKVKPKRASLLKTMQPEEIRLDTALALLALPREVGLHPRSNEPVLAANGRYGPYVKCGKETRSITADLSVLDLSLTDAVTLLDTPAAKKRGPKVIRELGTDPSTDLVVKLMDGRYGPYVTDGSTNASLPKQSSPDDIDLDGAVELIRKREKAPKRPRRKNSRTKKTSKRS
ncbi:MAG: topoisomerase C-terminal repeat-containing protein, partial [Myxococcota bacterium]|nr:topoisomerase C-terminal repeat-containing protein [Myxococcota bacterium]